METNKEKAIIEAILFSMGEAVKSSKIETALECDKKHVRELVAEMIEDYKKEDRGIQIIEIDDAYQLCTKNDTYEYLIKVVKIPKNFKLTDIQLETLSIIAYKQPITKTDIEKIRGVASDHAVNKLVEAGLVEEKGRLNTPGRPLVFGTTEEFLRRFGLKNKEDLPDIQTEKVEEMKLEAEEEIGYLEEQAKAKEAEQKAEESDIADVMGELNDYEAPVYDDNLVSGTEAAANMEPYAENESDTEAAIDTESHAYIEDNTDADLTADKDTYKEN